MDESNNMLVDENDKLQEDTVDKNDKLQEDTVDENDKLQEDTVDENDKLQEDTNDMDTMDSELCHNGENSVISLLQHDKSSSESDTNDKNGKKPKIILDLTDEDTEQVDAEKEDNSMETVAKEPEKMEIAYLDDPLIYYLPQGSKKHIEEVKTLAKDIDQDEELTMKDLKPKVNKAEYVWKSLEPESTECIPNDIRTVKKWKTLAEDATFCSLCKRYIGNTINKHKAHKKSTEHSEMLCKWEEKHGLIKHFFKKRNEIVSSMLLHYKGPEDKTLAFWQKISEIYFKMPINMHHCCGLVYDDAKEFVIHKSTLQHLGSEDFAKLRYHKKLQEIFSDPFLEVGKEFESGSHAKSILQETEDHFGRQKQMICELLSFTPSAQLMPDKKSIAPYDPAIPQGLGHAKFRTVFECRICDLYYGTAKYFLEHCKSLDHYENMMVYKRKYEKVKENIEKDKRQKEFFEQGAVRLQAHRQMVKEKKALGISFYHEEDDEIIDYGNNKTWCRRIGLFDTITNYCGAERNDCVNTTNGSVENVFF